MMFCHFCVQLFRKAPPHNSQTLSCVHNRIRKMFFFFIYLSSLKFHSLYIYISRFSNFLAVCLCFSLSVSLSLYLSLLSQSLDLSFSLSLFFSICHCNWFLPVSKLDSNQQGGEGMDSNPHGMQGFHPIGTGVTHHAPDCFHTNQGQRL